MNIIKDEDFRDYIAQTQRQSIRPASDFVDEAMDMLENGISNVGDTLPWIKTHDTFRFREGELTIWAGVNGNGKSLVMGQTALWLIKHTSVLIASMEMSPKQTIARMLRQGYGGSKPDQEFAEIFKDRTDFNLWVYDQTGSIESDKIIGMIHWAAEKKGIKHIMIDSLVKCGVNQDNNEAQKRFVDALCWTAKHYKVHIHLVNHMRKPHGEAKNYTPDKFSIKGAGEITDLADNVLIVHRNAEKYDAVINNEPCDSEDPDGFIYCLKQRNGEWEGLYNFWWNPDAQQWVPEQDTAKMIWYDY
jgi:twinkle protein